jgi:hypothetical protein
MDLNTPATPATPVGQQTVPPVSFPCPNPLHLTLTAGPGNVLNNVFAGDFSAAALAASRTGLNDSGHDKFFLCTFTWRLPRHCCQITRAVLTVKMKSNKAGTSKTSSDAGNDTISISHAGLGGAALGESVYSSWPFPIGTPSVKTYTLSPDALAFINTNHRLSFSVQDDTMVQSATLELWGCCLSID